MGDNISKNIPEVDTDRGIKNAQTRYREHSYNRLTSTQLQSPGRKRGSITRSQSRVGNHRMEFRGVNKTKVEQMYREIREIFSQGGQDISESDIREISELKTRSVAPPKFPYFIFVVAALKDSIDVIATLVVVGIPLTVAFSVLMSIILFFWTMGKMSGGWWRKKMIRYILIRFGLTFTIELVPLVNIVPTNTIYILLVHYREKKIVKLINLGLEKLHHSGVG